MRSIRFKRSCITASFIATSLAGSVYAHAQQDQGAVVGVVTDSAGAVIPNAQVTLTNTDQGLVLKVTADGHGVYSFSPVKIGDYSVSVTAPGFSTTTQENLHVDVQQRLNVDLNLKPGSESQNVTVSTVPPVLQTEEASVNQVFDQKALNDTPLNGRNWLFIAQLAAGVAPPSGARGAGTGDFSANGARSDQNNFILDGVDNNVNVVDFLNGASYTIQPPPDAMAEVKIQTSSSNAEFGHSAGAVVNASTKSGSNSFHGSFWEYLRNDAFNTHQYFDRPTDPIPKYRQNIFGGTLGGPVLQNRLFFFGDAQGNRVVNGRNQIITVPTALERQGDFSELLDPAQIGGSPIYLYQQRSGGGPNPQAPGATLGAASPYQQSYNGRLNVLNPSAINPLAQRILNLYPLPNRVNTSGGLLHNNFTSPINNTDNTVQWDGRIDYNASARDQAFVRYSYQHQYQFYPPPLGSVLDGGGFGTDGNEVNVGEGFAFSETHVFSPRVLNEFRFGYNYGHFYYNQPNATNLDYAASFGFGGIPTGPLNGGLPNVGIGGINGFGAPNYYPSNEHENVWQALDNESFSLGNHSLRVGVNIQHIRFSTLQPPQGHGNYNYTGAYSSAYGLPNIGYGTGYGVADFLSDNQHDAALSSISTVDDVRWDRSVYVQDDWKASPKLTLNLGLRAENQSPYFERHDNQAAFYSTAGVSYNPSVGQQGQSSSAGVYVLPDKARTVALPAAFTNALQKDNIAIQYTSNRYLVDYQKINWGPRIGIAYKLSDASVLRAGFGLFYGGFESIGFAPNLGLNYPFTQTPGITNPGNLQCTAGNGCLTDGITLAGGYTNFLANGGLANAIGTPSLRGIQNNVKTPYTYQFNMFYQQDVGQLFSASIGYVGSITRHASNFVNVNSSPVITPNCNSAGPGGAPTNTPCGTGNAQNPFSDVNISYQLNDGISSYNSLQAKLEKRLGRNLGFLATYTWSHQLTDSGTAIGQGDNFTSAGSSPNYYIFGTRQGYASGPEDVRNRFTFNGNYVLPFGKGQRFLDGNGIASQALGGWQITLTDQIQGGEPFTVGPANFTGVNNLGQNAILIRDPFKGGGTPDPSLNWPKDPATGVTYTCPTKVRTLAAWFNPCAYKNPLSASAVTGAITTREQAAPFLGDRANQIAGPGYNRTDSSLFKSFPIYHESQLQVRADIFNIFNSPAFTFGGGNDGPNGAVINPGSYRFFQNNTPNSRFFQFALRYSY